MTKMHSSMQSNLILQILNEYFVTMVEKRFRLANTSIVYATMKSFTEALRGEVLGAI
jgi:hypothetical protein